MRLGEEGPLTKLKVHLILKRFDHFFFCFQVQISNSNGGCLDMLTQLPLLGFPGSLTIFLLSLISSWCKWSNRGAGDGGMRRGGERTGKRRGERFQWVGKVKRETARPSPSAAGSQLS